MFTITAFKENVNNVIVTMHLYNDLLKYLDEGFLAAQFPQQRQMLRIKQHVVLDLILKAQIIVESSLILVHELSKGYSDLSTTMTQYENRDVGEVMRKVWKKGFSILPALGLQRLESLSLEPQEEELLNRLYEKTVSYAWEQLVNLADFYDKLKTVYHKYKHGLILHTGATASDEKFHMRETQVQRSGYATKGNWEGSVIGKALKRFAPVYVDELRGLIPILVSPR